MNTLYKWIQLEGESTLKTSLSLYAAGLQLATQGAQGWILPLL